MRALSLDAAVFTGSGRVRKNNEDSFYLDGQFNEPGEADQELALDAAIDSDAALFAVCDGMGGLEKGEIASGCVVGRMEALQEALGTLQSEDETQSTVNYWIAETNSEVWRKVPGSGTTLVMLYFSGGSVQAIHAGDSRAYRLNSFGLSRLTEDHSEIARLLRMGMITPQEIRTHPQRHAINRYLGINPNEYRCEGTFGERIPVAVGDRYLLCSDGVTDMLSDQKLYELMRSDGDSAGVAKAIYEAAMAEGGEDNTTVLVVTVCERGEKPVGRLSGIRKRFGFLRRKSGRSPGKGGAGRGHRGPGLFQRKEKPKKRKSGRFRAKSVLLTCALVFIAVLLSVFVTARVMRKTWSDSPRRLPGTRIIIETRKNTGKNREITEEDFNGFAGESTQI